MEAPASGDTLQVDAELAVGPAKLVLVSNASVSLRAKNDGSQIASAALEGTFFTPANAGKPPATPHIGDPDVIYDQRAERFWVVAIEVDFSELVSTLPCYPDCPITKGWLHVAVSPDDDPTDLDWEVFTFDIQGEPFEDVFDGLAHFLNIATDDDYLYIACTDSVDRSNFGTWRTTILILEKEPMLAEKDPTPPDLEWVRLHEISQTWGHAIGTKDWAGSSADVMYLVAPANPPLKEPDQYQTHMNVVGLYLDDDEWVAEAFPEGIELPAPYFGIDSVDGAPVPALPMGCSGTPKMTLVQSACIHGVQHGTGKSASLWTTLHCREDIKSEPGQYHVVRWFEISLNGWPFEMDDPEFRQRDRLMASPLVRRGTPMTRALR